MICVGGRWAPHPPPSFFFLAPVNIRRGLLRRCGAQVAATDCGHRYPVATAHKQDHARSYSASARAGSSVRTFACFRIPSKSSSAITASLRLLSRRSRRHLRAIFSLAGPYQLISTTDLQMSFTKPVHTRAAGIWTQDRAKCRAMFPIPRASALNKCDIHNMERLQIMVCGPDITEQLARAPRRSSLGLFPLLPWPGSRSVLVRPPETALTPARALIRAAFHWAAKPPWRATSLGR